jgi:hypothetical protein
MTAETLLLASPSAVVKLCQSPLLDGVETDGWVVLEEATQEARSIASVRPRRKILFINHPPFPNSTLLKYEFNLAPVGLVVKY